MDSYLNAVNAHCIQNSDTHLLLLDFCVKIIQIPPTPKSTAETD